MSRREDKGPRDFLLSHLESAVIDLRAAAAWANDVGLGRVEDDCNEAAATMEKHYYALKKEKL